MAEEWREPQTTNRIRVCPVCGTPPAASVQVGGGAMVFWFECRTCGRRTAVRASFEEARQEWNGD